MPLPARKRVEPYYNRPVQPPASLKALGDPIYEAFYGLTEQPFAITTDPRFFYLSASHQRAFSELLNGLRRRESVLLVTGESGTGKTTLCRAVLQTLGERTFSALILNPYMAGAEVLRIVLRDFGLVSNEDLRRGALSSADVPQSSRNCRQRSASADSSMASAASASASRARRKPWFGSCWTGTGPRPFQPARRNASRPRWYPVRAYA